MYLYKCDFKILNKMYEKKFENIFLTIKSAIASSDLRWVLDPSQYWLAHNCCMTSETLSKNILDPPISSHKLA